MMDYPGYIQGLDWVELRALDQHDGYIHAKQIGRLW